MLLTAIEVVPITLLLVVIFLWTAGALYFDAGQGTRWGWVWLLIWTVFATLAFVYIRPFWQATVVFGLVFVGILIWWRSQRPSHDRQWDPNFTRLPRIDIEGDQLTVHNIRNTEYRSLEDYDVRYETRHYRISDLKSVDLLILYWGSPWISHPMVIFEFDDQPRLCFSIEVRVRAGRDFDIVRSLYRQDELMYVVCDERDAILRRTRYSENHDCYLYRLQTDDQFNRELLQEYLTQTNAILQQPRWYNAITANCTTSVYRQRKVKIAWDWRILFNGSVDRLLYERGRLYPGLQYKELREQSWINDRANGATKENFSPAIRKGLPGF